MKKLFSILAIATLLSCSKDDENSTPDPACDCGTVLEVKTIAEPDAFYKGTYLTKIKNNCTGVVEELRLRDKYEIGWYRCN